MRKEYVELMVYTREANADNYPEGLAYSIHMACRMEGDTFVPLNKNYGILFAEALISQDNIILPKGVKDPKICSMGNGIYGIHAIRVNEDGSEDVSCLGKVLLWKTKDFIEFEHVGLVSSSEVCGTDKKSCIEIDKSVAERAALYWNPIVNTEVRVPEAIEVSSEEELDKVGAVAVYSDGSIANKKVVWKKETIDFAKPGIYEVQGDVLNREFSFPLTIGYGDPVIFPWEGKWYYISTNDNLNDIGLYVREADTVENLFVSDAVEHLILGLDRERGFIQTFWAPEFHVIGEELYILFAVGGEIWGPQCHLMKLKKGQSIVNADSWEEPVRVRRKDGGFLTKDGITLDMTYIKADGRSYMVWSYRKDIGTPMDTGSMLYIATVDEKAPWVLTSDPVLLSRPLFGWENVAGTINNEGPYAFVSSGKVYLTYSGGSANAYTYALGLLTSETKADLLDVSVWKKQGTPVLSFYSVEGEYGPGHNSFYTDEEGNLMIAYHAETALDSHIRCDGVRRVHFRKDGSPVFGMSKQEDLNPALRKVTAKVTVK